MRLKWITLAILTFAISGQELPRPTASAFSGTFEVTVNERGSIGAFGLTEEYSFVLTMRGTVKLTASRAGVSWVGTYDPAISFASTSNIITPGSTCTITKSYTGPLSKAGANDRMDLEVAGNNYTFRTITPVFRSEARGSGFCAGPAAPDVVWWPFRHSGAPGVQSDPFLIPLPATGRNLTGQKDVKIPGYGFGSLIQMPPTFTYVVKWDLRPEELEVVIEPEGYDTWRPEAGPNEDTIGNTIKVKAKLQNADGSAPNVEGAIFKFDLLETSQEPGIAMNFPQRFPQTSHDLQISPLNNDIQKLFIKNFEGQNAETRGPLVKEQSITLSSFDWGGWTRLKVTAEVPGVAPIVGYLKNDRSMQEVRFPKRAKDSFIADVWKIAKGLANAPDKEDAEKEPKGLPGCDGDGLTIYEEYRGFIENGKHIEGNVDKKDFFILNLIGADAEPGIWLFTEATQLEVHKDLKEDELLQTNTLLNRNCDKCPQIVQQHGVAMAEEEGLSGGVTYISPYGNRLTRGRPGLTTGIFIQPRYGEGSANSTNGLASADRPFLYDKIVAHELGHSVGLDHHGEGDREENFYLIPPEHPDNKLGKAYLSAPQGDPVTFLDEVSGVDAITRIYSAYLNGLAYLRFLSSIGEALDAQSAKELLETLTDLGIYVGRPSQQHSGAGECIMRYTFAAAYPKEGSSPTQQTFYLTPPGTEPLGTLFCDTAAGTLINKSPRMPQPRYFDAATGRGACRHFVCVNDAIPPGVD